MRSDYDTIKEILDKRFPMKRNYAAEITPIYLDRMDGGKKISIDSVDGYEGFYTDLVFDKDGTLISVDAWE